MKVKITLSGQGGELDSATVEVESESDAAIVDAALEILEGLAYLSVGDSLTVEEVRS